MLGAIQMMDKTMKEKEIRLYACTPEDPGWNERVFGSQGVEEMYRHEQLDHELARIINYHEDQIAKGEPPHLASFARLFGYLHGRELIER